MKRHFALLLACALPACTATPNNQELDLSMPPGADLRMDPQPDMAGATCQPLPTDYQPQKTVAGWAACVSDNNQYNAFDPQNISTIARVAAFEEIATLLIGNDKDPTAVDFMTAKTKLEEANGLGSRLDRREDEHYPPVVDGMGATLCSNMAMAMANPDRCIGPARMRPLLNDAFNAGGMGTATRVNAAKIEAGLLWFLFISTYKEAITCTNTKVDCDSSWAYYSGGEQRAGGKGLARYAKAPDPTAHSRTFDGLLSVRCWRDLDPAIPATNLMLRDRATKQLDTALIRGTASIVVSRVKRLKVNTGDRRSADWAFIQILGNALLREARVRDMTRAAAIKAELDKADPATVGADTLIAALEAVFPCP
jgi:hypothetical protein